MRRTILLLSLQLFLLVSSVSPDPYIRYNQAGYHPDRPKSLVLISNMNQKDQSWTIHNDTGIVMRGKVTESVTGKGIHTSHNYNHVIDFSGVTLEGDYLFQIGDKRATIRVSNYPYSVLITDALRHLKTARSGTEDVLNHSISHRGDTAAILYQIDGSPENGQWVKATPQKTVNCLGGWYDAGDFIKFTLTIANTVYYLLEAWEGNPKAFTKVLSSNDLPDVLDEALHGLNYLMKMHPEPDLFIIQVGNSKDHDQNTRLPEDDYLDGKRPALSAVSPVHMGLTAAALAKGARVFRSIGKQSQGDLFLEKARTVYERALQSDALTVPAYEKDETNDFYRDNSLDDNMALGAAELYKTTGDVAYLNRAKSYNIGAGEWIGWSVYNLSVNTALAGIDSLSNRAALKDLEFFVNSMDVIWGLPMDYTWSSLLGWNSIGAAAGSWNLSNPDTNIRNLQLKMIDYLFGRNNWGVSFLASTRLANTVCNIYNPVYWLTDIFPQGAVALGPANRSTHKDMEQYFGKPPVSLLDSFHTSKAVFYDWEKDFVTSETVTMSQSYAIWLMAISSDLVRQAPADSSIPPLTTNKPEIDSICRLPLNLCSWYFYSDEESGGNSSAKWLDESKNMVILEPKEGAKDIYAGFCISLPRKYQNLSGYDGIIVYGSFEQNAGIRVDLAMKSIDDYDHYGNIVLGNGSQPLTVMFSDISQQGFGKEVKFSADTITQINFTYFSTLKPTTMKIDSVHFIRIKDHQVSYKTIRSFKATGSFWKRNGRLLGWNGKEVTTVRMLDILGRNIWAAEIQPGKRVLLPVYKGVSFLISGDGKLIERVTSY